MKHGLICGRFQPLHLGHVSLIKKALSECDHLTIMVGSAQDILDDRNFYTYSCRLEMIKKNFNVEMSNNTLRVFPIVDIHNPPKWAEYVLNSLTLLTQRNWEINVYFAGSEEDAALFRAKGIRSVILPRDLSDYKSGTEIRAMLVSGNLEWRNYVPELIWDLADINIFRENGE